MGLFLVPWLSPTDLYVCFLWQYHIALITQPLSLMTVQCAESEREILKKKKKLTGHQQLRYIQRWDLVWACFQMFTLSWKLTKTSRYIFWKVSPPHPVNPAWEERRRRWEGETLFFPSLSVCFTLFSLNLKKKKKKQTNTTRSNS